MLSRVVVVDYGMGNLHSVAKALEHASDGSHDVLVSGDPVVINSAERVVFPGVGAIRDCMAELQQRQLDIPIRRAVQEKPLMAVCVGMQALMQHSTENNGVEGLGIFNGEVSGFSEHFRQANLSGLKVPHMGWNTVTQNRAHPMWHNICDNSYFYFVHSYCVPLLSNDDARCYGWCDYGIRFAAAISKPNVFATQFHPEKSHRDGLQLYRNFLQWDGKL